MIDDRNIGVTYSDHTTHAGATRRYRCRQILTFGNDGRIARIRHEELPSWAIRPWDALENLGGMLR